MMESKRGFCRSGALAALVLIGLARPAAADILIGLTGPMTGDNASFGEQMRVGANAAIEEVNSNGGVLGQKLKLVVEDDGCDPRMAVPVAAKLVTEKVDFVIGPFCSEVTLPASTIFADNGTVEITLSSNSRITEQGFDGLFRITGRDDQQGSVLADFIAEHHSGKRVALVTDHSAYDVALASGLRDTLKQQGKVAIALDQSIEAGTQDFSALVSAFQASRADLVIYIGYPLEAGLIINQAAQAGLKLEYISANNMSSRKIWEIAGRNAEGLAFTFLPAAELFLPAQDVVAQFKSKHRKTEGYTLYAYAAVEVFAAGLSRAKSIETEAVAMELQKGDIPTVLGDVSFDDKGDNLLPGWQIFNWLDGAYIYFSGE